MPRKINIVLLDSGRVEVEFVEGEHFTKRELIRVINSIKVESRHKVRDYRRKQRIKLLEEQKENGLKRKENRKREQEPRDEFSNRAVENTVKNPARPSGGLAAAITAKQQRRRSEGPRES